MADVVLFGGTTEGRIIAERFSKIFAKYGTKLVVCVATEYGASLIKQTKNVSVHVGRMDKDEMVAFLAESGATLCVDATHPYAVDVTANIQAACEETSIASVRVARDLSENGEVKKTAKTSKKAITTEDSEGIIITNVGTVNEAIKYLAKNEGKVFIATGSKELDAFTKLEDYKERCVARVLSTKSVVEKCAELGFEGKNLIAMQGPFSEELNYEMLKLTGAKWLVTKNSGKEGGYVEKCEAAIRAGVNIIIIGRPKETSENMVEVEECLDIMIQIYKHK